MDESELFREALVKARQKVDELKKKRISIDREIARWEQTVMALSALRKPTVPLAEIKPAERLSDMTGFTDMIRDILKAATTPLTAPDIKHRLDERGYKWKTPENALQAIHAVLKRLTDSPNPDVFANEFTKDGKKRTGYVWVGDIPF